MAEIENTKHNWCFEHLHLHVLERIQRGFISCLLSAWWGAGSATTLPLLPGACSTPSPESINSKSPRHLLSGFINIHRVYSKLTSQIMVLSDAQELPGRSGRGISAPLRAYIRVYYQRSIP